MANKNEKEDIIEGEEVESNWDLRKIALGVVVISIIGLLGIIALSRFDKPSFLNENKTLGVSNRNEDVVEPPSTKEVEKIINETREAITNISPENLISSQAAIQKMISNLEILQGKKDVKDVICDAICKK